MRINYSSPNIYLSDYDYEEIRKIIESGWVSIGPYTRKLEAHFKQKCGVDYAIACANATTGLIIALQAAGWQDKKVALPAFTWPSTAYAIETCQGARPVYHDIDPKTWLMVEPYLEHDAILAVDVFGNQETDLDEDGPPIIFDAAHGYNLPYLGVRGLAEVVSLSFTKLVTGTEGGIILTNNDQLAEKAKELRRLSGRLEEVNAYIALKSIAAFGGFENRRKQLREIYLNNIEIPFERQETYHYTNYSVFALLFENSRVQKLIKKALNDNGVEIKQYYKPLVEMPTAMDIYSRMIALPTHAGVTNEDALDIANIISDAL